MTECSYDHPYLVVGVKELPPQPWPTFVADMPLFLNTSPEDRPFHRSKNSRVIASNTYEVNGRIADFEVPEKAVMVQIFSLSARKGAQIESIRWDGIMFKAFGKQSPGPDCGNYLPCRINGFTIGYVWGNHFSGKDQENAYRQKIPTSDPNVNDDSDYFQNGLLPGVMIGGLHQDGQ